MTQTKFWDPIEGRHVERAYDTQEAMETFGELPDAYRGSEPGEAWNAAYASLPDGAPMWVSYENQGTAHDPGAFGYERQGRRPDNDNAPVALQPERSSYRNPRNVGWDAWSLPRPERGPYIGTFTGKFWPFDPRPEEVDIVHVAHSLAMTCRYTGACIRFYSVAEHSVHIARWLQCEGYSPDTCLAALLHDAPESLSGFGDNARPSKVKAPIIKETEERIYRLAVAPAFGLSAALPDAVHEADSRIVADEMSQNMRERDPAYNNPLGIELKCWPPYQAEEEFLAAFYALMDMRDLEVAA